MKTTPFLCTIAMAASVASAAVSYEPVTAGATGGARKLYNFLATNYGVRTVSGVMTGDVGTGTDVKKQVDVDTLFQRSGKYPALVGFDFLFATGVKASDAWYKSYTNTALALAKDLWTKGGIPAFTWHWKDPSDSIDAFYTKSGNAKEYTTFDFTKGFQAGTTKWDTTSATYKQLVSDIDEIAALFLSLQKDSVAAVFRPLHEGSGGWFWWGTKGGPAYQALYNLVHDRMVETDGVKNLVWVWNPNASGDLTWNPGATRYDVISLDIYGAYDYTKKFATGYQELTTNYGASNKIFAVSENGPIPDASTMKANNAVWSWWMPWYQSWSGKFLDQTVDPVWKANMADPCVVTLDEMPGWDAYALSEASVSACQVGYALGDLDSTRPVVVRFPGDTATNAWLQVQFATPADDTAKGNVIIASGTVADLSKATEMTLKVVNGNTQSGVWFTVAFLGNAATDWGWAQPEGCWVNAGDSALCTFDLTTTTQDKVVLTGDAYATFMSNLNKVYLEIFGDNWSGNLFFDDVKAGSTVINDFEKAATIKFEQAKNLEFAKIVGGGSKTGVRTPAHRAGNGIAVVGRSLRVELPQAGTVAVELLDVQGHRVATLHRGSLAAGAHAFDLRAVKPGLYVVHIGSASRKVVVE